ncbi:flavin monoamine oxidase family protein [Rubrobacter indicoceani]|uniref:flavin monoamine oxidase family protein n=1 Tax=Rubrobacter indicoceani TaxID=2051957 RepID=UPI000E5C14F4|nr:NAD(P)/FAD-dependent oxidoreductase [Rubrobacter indicoceani]
MNNKPYPTDVVVVGAGLSGLVAARELVRDGAEVTVLEARDRPGGRTCTREVDGVTLDLGGEWVDAAHTALRDLVEELGLELAPTSGKKSGGLWYIRGESTDHIPLNGPDERIYRRMNEAMHDVSGSNDTGTFLRNAPHHRDVDVSVRTWLLREGMSDDGLHVLETLLASCGSTVPLGKMSFYAYANKAATRGGPGKGNEYRVVGGAGSVAATMAGELSGRISYSSPVVGIEQDEDGVSVRCITSDGYVVYRGRKAILAVPPPVWRRIEFSPDKSLPLTWRKMSRRASYGIVRKLHFVFEGDTGEVPFTVSDGPLGYCGASQSGVGLSGVVSFSGGEPLLPELGLSKENRLARDVQALTKLYDVPEPKAVVESVWAEDVYSGGSYMILAPGDLATFGGAMGGSFGNLQLAGCEGYAPAPSFMNSAVVAGIKAAERVSGALGGFR